jgi:hypothetical protein
VAFKTDSRRILAGSLNLTMPGDIVPAGDALTLTNWRADQEGILRARSREAALAGLGPYNPRVVQLYLQQGVAPVRYVVDRTNIYRGASPIASNPGGQPAWFVTYQGYTWILNGSVSGRVSLAGSTLLPWVPAAPVAPPTVATGSAGNLTGSYQYFVTFVTADGIESDPSPFSGVVSPSGQFVNMSAIPVSADPSVTVKWIYRAGGTQDQSYRVVVIANATTTFTDGVPELTAALLGITHTFDHDPPPAAVGICGPYYESLVAWSTSGNPNWIWWTKPDQPWYWPGSNFEAGQHAPVGEDGEAIVRITNHDQQLFIYKQRSIWRAVGNLNSQSSFLVPITHDVGLVGSRAICTAGGVDFFEGPEGIYTCNGQEVKKVSGKLDPLFKGDLFSFERGMAPTLPISLDPLVRANNVMAHRNGRVYYFYGDFAQPGTISPYPNTGLVLDLESGKWAQDSRAFSALYDEGAGLFLTGALDTSIYDVEQSETGTIPTNYVTHAFDADLPRNNKTWADLEIESDLGASSLAVNALYDFGATWQKLGDIANNARTSQVLTFPFDTQSKNLFIQIVGDVVNRAMIYAVHVRFRVEQRDALTFDTGPLSLNPGKWNEFLEFALNVKAPGALSWKFYTDEGGQMKLAASGQTDALGTERAGIDVPFGRIIEGRECRLVLSSAAAFQVYECQLRMRRLGTYLVKGAVWGERPQNLGNDRVKLFKKIEVDSEGGGFTLSGSTDVPGDVLALRGDPLVYKGGPRQWTVYRLAANTRGRFLLPLIISAGNVKLFRVRVWWKMLGEVQALPWQFTDLPIEETAEVFSWVPIPVDE